MILTPEELIELTNRVRYSAQAKMLRAMGIEHRIRADGTLAVSRVHVEQVLGGGVCATVKAKEWEPDWSRM